jgi:hypothetical protein
LHNLTKVRVAANPSSVAKPPDQLANQNETRLQVQAAPSENGSGSKADPMEVNVVQVTEVNNLQETANVLRQFVILDSVQCHISSKRINTN